MIRREIKNFKMDCDGVKDYAVAVPFTLYSALCDLGRVERVITDPGECSLESMRVYTTFTADDTFFNEKYTYLRLKGITSPCEVYLNGGKIGSLDGKRRQYLLDTQAELIKGENKLELVFSSPQWHSGLLCAIEFLKFSNAIIDRVKVQQRREGEAVVLDIELFTVGDGENSRAVATLISGSGQIYYGGFSHGKATVTVRDPLYWWPSGLGVQNVYKLSVNLYGEVEAEDGVELKIGLRSLTKWQGGQEGMLEINGNLMLPMGAVYSPGQVCLPSEHRRRTAAIVTSAAMGGFNTLIIKAGEPLPQDDFFDLCDVHGIAVICELDRLDDATYDTVSRLCHHPSFAPVELLGMRDKSEEISQRFAEIAPCLEFSLIEESAEYFGQASIPCDKTTFSIINQVDRNIFSDAMELHSGGEIRSMAASVSENYLYAWNPSDFAYLTRLSQAENCKSEMMERRMGFGTKGRAVFSGLSSHRLISDSAIDPAAGWKAVQYYASRFFAPVAICAKANGTSVTFSATNSGKAAAFGMLECRIVDSSNTLIYKSATEVDIPEHSSVNLFTRDFAEQIDGHDCDRYLEYILTEGSHVLYRGSLLFVPQKRFKYKNPKIKTEIIGAEKRYSITVSSSAYASGVELSFEGIDAVFSDNYFDITTPAPMKINFTVSSPVENVKSLTDALRIRTLYQVGRIN